jgi:hypothetical protein
MCSEIPRGIRRLIQATVILLTLLSSVTSAHAGLTLEELLKTPHFDASEIERVRRGGLGIAKIHEVSDREIGLVIACRVEVAPEDALAPFLGDSLPIDRELLQQQMLIDTDLHEASFDVISLGRDDHDEIRHYLEAKPGVGLNLSSDEIAAFQALKDSDDPAQVEAVLRDMLRARYTSYRAGGLAGARPYAREEGGHISPGEELRKTEENMTGLHEIYPNFHNAWLRYPRELPDDIVGDDFFWVKLDIEGRPAFVLSHRLVVKDREMHLVGIRDYYVSHFLDVSQRAAVVTRIESGENILLYFERLWVDHWSGFAKLSKKIGHKILKRQMEHLLQDHGICGGS